MHRRHGIRANLPANKEDRRRQKVKARKDAFGVYRPLTPESTVEVINVLAKAATEIGTYFADNRNSPAELVIPAEMGVTFVPLRHVRRALGRGLVERLENARLLERIETHTLDHAVAQPVSLDRTDWYSDQERKLVYLFADCTGQEELEREAEVIQDMLADSKAHELEVFVPDHFTLMKYGRARDGQDLGTDHKQMVGGIVERHFRQAGLLEIELGRLVLGKTYTGQEYAEAA
jgi:hypothetical protein